MKEVKFSCELLEDMLDELKPLLPIHWLEIANDQDTIPLDPDYEWYLSMEKNGHLQICTARKEGVLVGYVITFIRMHPHYKTTKFGNVDIYYLVEECRNNGVGARFFKFHEFIMKSIGVHKLVTMVKTHHDHSPLFKALGYTHTEELFGKIL